MIRPDTVPVSDARAASNYKQNIILTAKGGSVLFIGRLTTFVSRFIVTFLLTRLLGPEQYGVYNIGLSAATIAYSLGLFGMDDALVRYVALWMSRGDDKGVWGSIQIGLLISMSLSTLTAVGLFVLSQVIAIQVFHDAQLAPVLQLVSVIVPFLTLSDVLAGATRGFKKMEHTVIAQNLIQPALRVILIIFFAIAGLTVVEAIIIYGLADLAASVVLTFFLNREFSLRRPLREARHDVKGVLDYSFPIWLSDLMTNFRSSIQTVLIGSLSGVLTVGIFSVANQLNLFADLVQSSATTAVKPIIVELHDRGNNVQLGRLYQTVSKWMFAFNLPVFLLIVLFPATILSIFGKGFAQGATALIILASASLVDAVTGMCGAVLDMTGYTKLKLFNSITRLALIMGLNVLLIPDYGIVGAAIAALVGETVVNLLRLVQVYILLRLVPYNRSSLAPMAAGLVGLVCLWAVRTWVPIAPQWVSVVVQSAAFVTAYAGLLLAFGMDREDRQALGYLTGRATKWFSKRQGR